MRGHIPSAGDGCSPTCTVEPAWYCNNTACGSSKCSVKCGDALKGGTEILPGRCDDGNMDNNDGCNGTCHIECGFTCVGGSANGSDICQSRCGDGILAVNEACDDNNTVDGEYGCAC